MENTTTQITSLYERLGGEVEIKKIVDDAIEAHMHNPGIRARFLPYLETPEDLDTAESPSSADCEITIAAWSICT